eukprot:GHVU01233461.1.p2 GENE.GHVU01233461.1~~GHVU01233461.1.p2  ORF type:complete len:108 (+),score=5.60 GHVU01233461.1:539-862(+)
MRTTLHDRKNIQLHAGGRNPHVIPILAVMANTSRHAHPWASAALSHSPAEGGAAATFTTSTTPPTTTTARNRRTISAPFPASQRSRILIPRRTTTNVVVVDVVTVAR